MSEFQTVRGMRDFLPKEAAVMKYVEGITRELAELYGFQEIITPLVESYGLLAAKSGEEIRQRMYAFEDLGKRKVALRPEFTASIARLMTTVLRNQPKPIRLYSLGSVYRYDEPQYGRYREIWQSNYELIGATKPEADVEILALTNDLLQRIGLHEYHFKIGHVGVVRGILSAEGVKEKDQSRVMQLLDKKQWNDALTLVRELRVSDRCVAALKRILEIKGEDLDRVLKEIGKTVKDYDKATAATANLEEIVSLLRDGGINLDMTIEAGFSRGLEYYTGAIYEVSVPQFDVSIAGGGRYDRLVELFGGESTPAVGIAHGIDRLTLAMEKQHVEPQFPTSKRVMIVPIGEAAKGEALKIAIMLRNAGLPVKLEVMGRTVSRALQDADREAISHAIIIGPKEVENKEVTLREMKKREQHTIKVRSLVKEIKTAAAEE